jgi:hypothetical protein
MDAKTIFTSCTAWTVPFHRMWLIIATLGLGVLGARIASTPKVVSEWVIAAGFCSLLAVADIARETELDARELATSSRLPNHQARRDLVRSRRPVRYGLLFVFCLALLMSGLLLSIAGS